MLDDNRKIGIGLCGIGVVCVFFGVCLLFDRTLLALGNVAFLVGLCMLLGMTKTIKFFFYRKDKWRGTAAFFGGIVLILAGWSVLGFVVEMYGVFELFRAFLPSVINSLKLTVPGVSAVLDTWPFSWFCRVVYDGRRLPV